MADSSLLQSLAPPSQRRIVGASLRAPESMEIIPDPVHVALLTLPFAVAALAVHLILWRPLLAWLDERDHTSAHAREEAARLDTQASEQLARIEARLAEARAHAGSLRQQARARAHAQETEIVTAART